MTDHAGENALVDYGMSYYLGRSCWHVVGYVNNDPMRSVLLCGGRRGEYGIGGGVEDVLASDVRICKVCDKVTWGQAAGDVDRLRVYRCDRCNENGLIWDPRVDGNVVACDHKDPRHSGGDDCAVNGGHAGASSASTAESGKPFESPSTQEPTDA